jgi:protein-tyrosine phosphatase
LHAPGQRHFAGESTKHNEFIVGDAVKKLHDTVKTAFGPRRIGKPTLVWGFPKWPSSCTLRVVKRMKTALALWLVFGVAHAPGQIATANGSPNFASESRTAKAKLKYFEKIDEGVYKGSKPRSDDDYRFLQSLHVKYIVDLQFLPWMTRFEQRKAKQYGITVIPGIMNASPISPSGKHIEKILTILRDERYHPVYFHCKLGRDRTAVIAALYKMYFLGMSQKEAMQYLHDDGYGFKYGWLRSGLTRYLRKHPTPPPALSDRRAGA